MAAALFKAIFVKEPAARPTSANLIKLAFLTDPNIAPPSPRFILPSSRKRSCPPSFPDATHGSLGTPRPRHGGSITGFDNLTATSDGTPGRTPFSPLPMPLPNSRAAIAAAASAETMQPFVRPAMANAPLSLVLRYLSALAEPCRDEAATADHPSTASPWQTAEATHRWWVTKWVDYSSKYGFAYQFACGALGVLFKDGDSMLLASNGIDLHTWPRQEAGGSTRATTVSFADPPPELAKKATLLTYFANYMKINLVQGTAGAEAVSLSTVMTEAGPFLTLWKRLPQGTLLLFSDSSFQMNFEDHTKIYIHVSKNFLSFTNAQRNSQFFVLETVCPSIISERQVLLDRLRMAIKAVTSLTARPD
eukprot:m.135779 g.135779  ORF g.135779 m.135779 type:complete len:363 (+) comp14877_c0_seq2:1126-2214(+)